MGPDWEELYKRLPAAEPASRRVWQAWSSFMMFDGSGWRKLRKMASITAPFSMKGHGPSVHTFEVFSGVTSTTMTCHHWPPPQEVSQLRLRCRRIRLPRSRLDPLTKHLRRPRMAKAGGRWMKPVLWR